MTFAKRRSKRPILNLKTQTFIPSEYQECKAFWQYACLMGFNDDLIKHANERIGDTPWFIRALFSIGFRKGLLDYQYISANNKYIGLWLEFKRKDQRNEKKMPEQEAWIARLLKKGHYASYAYGCDDAIKIYTDYINNRL
jgi:hypothetical protein